MQGLHINTGGPKLPAPKLKGIERPVSLLISTAVCGKCKKFVKWDTIRIIFDGFYQEYYGPTYGFYCDCKTCGTQKLEGEFENISEDL
jgi:hypothetical protein